VGKTALVQAFATRARAAGAVVLHLDGGSVEPTERGLLAGLSSTIGGQIDTTADALTRLAGLGDRVVLIIDRYEVLRPLDLWLQQTFVPALDDTVRVVLSGREPPMPGWHMELGPMFRSLPLGNLSRSEAEALLRRDGVAGEEGERINRLARGHPLSLRLAAAAIESSPTLDHGASTITALVGALAELYLAGLDPLTRRALDAAAMVRRPTLTLFGAMLPDAAPQDAFDRVRDLPFVQLSDDGLLLHDTVREIVGAYLRATDPDRARRYRIAAWRQLRDEVARASTQEMWRYTADLLYMLENTMIREAFFPTTEHRYFVTAATDSDWPSIETIAARNEPSGSVAIAARWWKSAPHAFRVARDKAGAVAGFFVIAEPGAIPRALVDADPVARRFRDHLRQRPLTPGERAIFLRYALVLDQENFDVVDAAMTIDQKRMYMELRPSLRRVYFADRAQVTPSSPWVQIGFVDISGHPPRVDDIPYYLALLDMGPGSVDGWLTRIIARELGLEEGSILDAGKRQLVLDGRRIDLTRLEFEVLNYLHERPGTVIDRASLLREIWGYQDATGSNNIDVLVRSIRRKLGDRASIIETARGLGYRYRASP
jgi:hypothetical protein